MIIQLISCFPERGILQNNKIMYILIDKYGQVCDLTLSVAAHTLQAKKQVPQPRTQPSSSLADLPSPHPVPHRQAMLNDLCHTNQLALLSGKHFPLPLAHYLASSS